MIDRVRSLLKHRIAQHTGWMLLAHGGRFIVQAIYFVVIARTLGVAEFGQFAAVAALANIVLPFANLGSGMLLVRDVARDRTNFPRAWGDVLSATTLAGGLLAAVVSLLLLALLPDLFSLQLVVLVLVSDLIFYNLALGSSQALLAMSHVRAAAATMVLLGATRCAAAVVFAASVEGASAERWAMWYLGGTFVAAATSVTVATVAGGLPSWRLRRPLRVIKEGLYFSFGLTTFTITADIDKTMLARLASVEAAGLYTAGYRVVSFATMPAMALISATYPDFFRHGATGVRPTATFALRLMRFTVGYAAVATIGLVALSPLISVVLGQEYAQSESIVRMLAVVVVAQAAHVLLANVLTGVDRQGLRTVLQVVVAGLNVMLNFWLIPKYEITGAIITTLVSECGFLLVFALAVALLSRNEASSTQERLP